MSQVVVVGSANADLTACVTRRPMGGETVSGGALVVTPGGKGANQATAAALLGANVAFVGCVGRDAHGKLLLDSLAGAGVDTTGMQSSDAATSVALIVVTPDGENSIIVCEGANASLGPELLSEHPEFWRNAALVVTQLEVPLPSVALLAAECRRRRVRFMLNAAPAAPLDAGLLRACDPLVVNESEAAFLLGSDPRSDPSAMLEDLLTLGPASVVLTLGEKGCLAGTTAGERIARDAKPVAKVVDTTGAGDAFVGGLAMVLGSGGRLAEGVETGTRAAAIAIQTAGASASYAGLKALRPGSLQ